MEDFLKWLPALNLLILIGGGIKIYVGIVVTQAKQQVEISNLTKLIDKLYDRGRRENSTKKGD